MKLQTKARWRKWKRFAATPGGKLRLAIMLALFGLSMLMMLFFLSSTRLTPAGAQPLVASGMFLLTLLSVVMIKSDAGIYFTPEEVDLLFPAPFSRRNLLLYRLATMARGLLVGSLIFSFIASMAASRWVFAYIGVYLCIAFLQLLSIALALAVSILGGAVYTRVRKIALGLILATVAFGVVQSVGANVDAGILDFFRNFSSSVGGRIVLFPFQVFSKVVTAPALFPDFLGWGTLAALIDGVLVVLILRLDVNFLESSAAASERLYKRIQRARAGQGWMNLAKPSSRNRLPMPGYFRGAGPIAWRQSVAALRRSRGIIYFFGFMIFVVGVIAFLGGKADALLPMMVGVVPMLVVFYLPQMLQFDFRGDLERIDFLKTLPASAGAIVAGELVAPVLAATIGETVIVMAVSWWRMNLIAGLVICLFLPVVNCLIFTIENLIFLWYPRRVAPSGPNFSGRQMLGGFVKMLILALTGGVSAAIGILAYFIFSSWVVALALGWLMTAASCLVLFPLTVRAFVQFDPSMETPD